MSALAIRQLEKNSMAGTQGGLFRSAAPVALLLALLGCGGDDFRQVRNLASTNEAIVCFGDSLTEGVGANAGEDYPTVLSRELAYPIVNAGRRGDTTGDALTRVAEVIGHNPRLVIVLLGGNDFLRQQPRGETKKNLSEVVRRIQAQGAMVALAGIRLGILRDEFAPIYEDIAKELGAYYIPEVMEGILANPKLKSDAIHPNGAGYRLIAQRIGEKIRPLLREADRLTGRRGF